MRPEEIRERVRQLKRRSPTSIKALRATKLLEGLQEKAGDDFTEGLEIIETLCEVMNGWFDCEGDAIEEVLGVSFEDADAIDIAVAIKEALVIEDVSARDAMRVIDELFDTVPEE